LEAQIAGICPYVMYVIIDVSCNYEL
jgi:hypothetical protein